MGFGKLLKGLVPAAAALLAGCGDTDGPSVVKTFDRGDVVESMFFSASRKEWVLAHVHGDPFGRGAADLETNVHTAMADAMKGRIVRFTSDASAVEQPQNHIIVVFGAPVNQNGDKLCSGVLPQTQAPTEQGRVDVRAVFCADGERLADAEGFAKRIDGADDPRFHRLMYDLAYQLILQRT